MYNNNPLKRHINSLDFISSKDIKDKITTSKTKLLKEIEDIDDITLYNKLSAEYKYTYFNVKGKFINIKFIEIQSNPLRFDSKLILKVNEKDDTTHTIAIKRAKEETKKALIKIKFGTLFYLTNLLTEICLDSLDSDPIFIVTSLSKIYFKSLKLNTPKTIKSKTVLVHSPVSYNSSKKMCKSIEQTLEQLTIKQLITIKDISELSYKELLSAPVENMINKVSNAQHILPAMNIKITNIIGRVISIRHINNLNGQHQYSLELMSLIDSNTFVIYLGKQYPQFITVNIIIHISNLNRKLNDKMIFIFYTNKSTFFRLIGDSSLIEMPKKEFGYTAISALTSLSYLMTCNRIIRYQISFIAKIKMIYRITGSVIKRNLFIDNDIFKAICLKGKVLIEDGTTEAVCYLQDQILVDTLNISKDFLDEMTTIIQSKDYAVLYDKYAIDSYIPLDKLNKALLNERYFIGKPFCFLNPNQRSTIWNIESRLFGGWSNKNDKIENLKYNFCFVNGMLYYLYNQANQKSINFRPSLYLEYSETIIENYD